MKRLVSTVLVAAIFSVAAYFLVDAFGYWYGERFIKSDSDINQFVAWGLVFMLICLIAGGFIGYRWGGRKRQPD